MRYIRILCVLFLSFLLLSVSVQAAEANLYEQLNSDALLEALPEEARALLSASGFSPQEIESNAAERFLFEIADSVQGYLAAPLRVSLLLLSTILLCRIVSEFAPDALRYTVKLCGTLACAGALLSPIAELLSETTTVIQAANAFLLAALPVYTGILVLSGNTVTGSTYGALTLAAANGISALCEQVFLPVTRIFLGFSAVSSVTSFDLKQLTDTLYKGIKWALTLAVTVFTGVLSLQTLISAQTDAVTGRTAKMIASSAVPIVGSAFGDAFTVLGASVGMVKSGTSAFGILAAAAIFLPLCLRIGVWILVCHVSLLTAALFDMHSISVFLEGCAAALKLMAAVLFSVGAVAVVSAAIVLCVRGAYG